MDYHKEWWERDKIWGFVLIIMGVAAITFQPFEKMDDWFHGETNYVLTALMIALAAGILLSAFYARPYQKALMLIWLISP